MSDVKNKLIKIAYENPELRDQLLQVINKIAYGYDRDDHEKDKNNRGPECEDCVLDYGCECGDRGQGGECDTCRAYKADVMKHRETCTIRNGKYNVGAKVKINSYRQQLDSNYKNKNYGVGTVQNKKKTNGQWSYEVKFPEQGIVTLPSNVLEEVK
jgi:hypothetical protein